MWREEKGFLEMFMAYFSQCEEHLTAKMEYRDFLFLVLCAHEASLAKSCSSKTAVAVETTHEDPSSLESDLICGAAASAQANVSSCEAFGSWEPMTLSATHSEDALAEIVYDDPGLRQAGALRSEWASEPAAAVLESVSGCSIKEEVCDMEEPSGDRFGYLRGDSDEKAAASALASSVEHLDWRSREIHQSRESGHHKRFASNGGLFSGDQHPMPPAPNLFRDDPLKTEGAVCDGSEQMRVSAVPPREPFPGAQANFSYALNEAFLQDRNGQTNVANFLKDRPFVCQDCGKAFRRGCDLRRHDSTHAAKSPVVCKTCGKSFKYLCILRVHERFHSRERPFVCKTCGKDFSQNCDLRRHERIHSGQKPYVCKTCFTGFSQASSLRRHERTHVNPKMGVYQNG